MTNTSVRVACTLGVLIACALLTTVAGTNFAVLFMLLTTPIVWLNNRPEKPDQQQLTFLILIAAFCLWDILTNLLAGHGLKASLVEDVHHVRTFGFILVLGFCLRMRWWLVQRCGRCLQHQFSLLV